MALLDDVKYANGDDADQRLLAVNAALELIAVRVTNNTTGGILEAELSRLSQYADTIQAALTGK
ncbi:hypothetical protein J2W17_003642 [Pseudomonas lini]|uniref:hypothetical protein n=1 Tax=Pseudomonas lini TaxID=163011 RepID=UPI00277F351E|nr:hypothetical protein [Pseudomonas lini]MDQ0124688.1 hypothetical protein [Pseudomonas lini]